ncbi:hypothetical protein [Chlamydia vaughanii]|uniref:hypothetical protein n=1 Tax=Chlamydia vaughanii TaxID=3112552 RepID=UPI0032B114C8
MTISQVVPNLSTTSPQVASKKCCKLHKYQYLGAIAAMVIGLLLLTVQVGILVCFALPTSLALTGLISFSIVVSVILLCLAMHQIILRCSETTAYILKDKKAEEEKAQIKAQVENLEISLTAKQEEIDLEKKRILELEEEAQEENKKLLDECLAKGNLIEELRQQIKQLEEQQIVVEPPVLEVRVRKLKEQLVLANIDMGKLRDKVEDLENQLASRQERLDEFMERRKKDSETIMSLHESNNDLVRRVGELQDEIMGLQFALAGKGFNT